MVSQLIHCMERWMMLIFFCWDAHLLVTKVNVFSEVINLCSIHLLNAKCWHIIVIFFKWLLFKHVLFLKVLHRVGIAMGYGLDSQGSVSDSGKRFFSTPQHLGWLWGPPSLLYNGYWGLFPRSKGWNVKLATQLHLEPRSRIVELYFHSLIHINGSLPF
jgi:hypothetical protein